MGQKTRTLRALLFFATFVAFVVEIVFVILLVIRQSSRSAVAIGRRAALIAGINPPTNPIISA
jgi:hypothetical protein